MGRVIETNKKRVEEKVAYLMNATQEGFSNAEQAILLLEQKRSKLEKDSNQQFEWILREIAELKAELAKRLPPLEATAHPSLWMRVRRKFSRARRSPAPPPGASGAQSSPSE